MSADTCSDCAAAAVGRHHIFTAGCMGCKARSVARSQPFKQSMELEIQTGEYRLLLKKMGVTHDEVKAARAVDWLYALRPALKVEP